MQFNSIIFLFLFLPLALGLFYFVPGKLKNFSLLLFSLALYTWGDQVFVLILLYSAVANYNCGLLIEDGKRKLGLILSLLINLLLLGFFKYYNFTFTAFHDFLTFFGIEFSYLKALPGLAAPLGISFFTFKTISYTLDVYHSKVKASRNFIEFATYVAMFPPLIAGPIVRYIDIQQQLTKKNISITNFSKGIERFIIGLAKKMIVANTFAIAADSVFSTPLSELSTSMAWGGIIAYTFQIYFDFSGYSDMAIGLGKMFGFDFPENFNYPYISRNIQEFWKRWHITLSSWLRDYLFLPMAYSVSRKLKKESYLTVRTDHIIYLLAIFITFLTCGIWHGASWNFVAWGLWYGIFISIEHIGFGRILKRGPIPLQHLYTLLVIVFGWVIFRTENLHQAANYFVKLFSFSHGDVSLNSYLRFFYLNHEILFMTLIAIIFSTPVYPMMREKAAMFMKMNSYYRNLISFAGVIFLSLLFIVSISHIIVGTYNAFIYARF
ncbi:MAG: MBOAT family protein [Bacteroidetes bacterium]|nr:MBOAT family protein [Bacteroidota bacterium]